MLYPNQIEDLLTAPAVFLPDLDQQAIYQLQQDTAKQLKLPLSFCDRMKVGTKGPEVAVIPVGQYEMGSTHHEFGHNKEEYPQHYIQIQKPYAIGRYTITADEFELFCKDTEWSFRDDLIQSSGKTPVINLRLVDVNLYLKWLSDQTGQSYRLPTESEWEHAARAGTTTAFHFGDEVTCKEVHFNALFPYNEAKQKKRWYLPRCSPYPKPIEVGDKPANAWGLHEVHGNVWEFTQSNWRDSHLNANRDGTDSGINDSPWYVTKGGSWFDDAIHSRSAARKRRSFEEMDTNLGFRVVRELV